MFQLQVMLLTSFQYLERSPEQVSFVPHAALMLIDPDVPANCFMNEEPEINGVENMSGKIEWFKPANRKGIISKYILEGSCVGRYRGRNELPRIEFLDPDETLDSYELVLSSMPSFSICNLFIAAVTRVGPGEKVQCERETPLICNIIYSSL